MYFVRNNSTAWRTAGSLGDALTDGLFDGDRDGGLLTDVLHDTPITKGTTMRARARTIIWIEMPVPPNGETVWRGYSIVNVRLVV